jgi:hydrogenase/urease accessory protein HupE
VQFPELPTNRINVLVRLARSDGSEQLGRVSALDPRLVFSASPGALEVARTYTVPGVEHILTGFDHLLFVLALLILAKGMRRLIATVTTFTVAHSLSLFAATLGWVHVAGPPVEAAIALSIVFVAAEIVHGRQGRPGLTRRWPWLVVFSFGLLHGLGFAGALAQVGLPPLSIPMALLFFSVGVEIGQLMFIAVMLTLMASVRWAARRLA